MTVKLVQDQTTASSSDEDDVSNSSSSEEEETVYESETERVDVSSKPTTKENSASPVANPVVKPSSQKRSSETDEGGEAKRVKSVSGEDDKKKTYFQRVWREEDEIVVLQGIIDYKNKTGSCPFDDKTAVYELVHMSISFDVTKTQFMEKIRALKKKFEKKNGGEEPAFSNPHDLKVFHLSKFVWGDDGIIAGKKAEPAVLNKQDSVSILEAVAPFCVNGLLAKKGWSKLSWEDKKTFQKHWEALEFEELNFYERKTRFFHDLITKMAEACQPNH